ncbi:MAG: GNAT family N-acetyltransferase [Bacteroidaceae bacterium]|nr:GNAT family N-acetyltransferase [Bacteroidaceae bacterium]
MTPQHTITYKDTRTFNREELQRLFLSVNWSSGHYPDRLVEAMKGYGSVFSAYDGDRLIGMICTMDDGVMTAYVHYLLVDPAYQGLHIGRELVNMMKRHYKDYLRIVLCAYNDKLPFYKSLGFKEAGNETTMFITELWT